MSVWTSPLEAYDPKYFHYTASVDHLPNLLKQENGITDVKHDIHYAKGVKLLLLMTSVNLVVFLTALDLIIVSTIVPNVTNQFRSFFRFQESSPIRSGIQTLPFIIAGVFSVTITGALVGITRYYVLFLFIGTALTALGAGSLYFLSPTSNQATWCGIQFFAGFGPGMVWMLPFIASSAALPKQDIPIGSAVVIFFQTLGGTLSVSIAQSIFQNKFVSNLHNIPGVNADMVLDKGVSAFRKFTSPLLLEQVINAANHALRQD